MNSVIKNDILCETMHFRQLKNGLNIYVIPKGGYNKQFAIYATKYGSNDIFSVPGEKSNYSTLWYCPFGTCYLKMKI